MSKAEDFAIAYANLKGPRDKDYIGTAKALQRLKSYPEYNTNEKLAKQLPVSGEMVRQFLSLLKLSEQIQRLFGPDGLKLEHGRRLWQLTRKRPELQSEVAVAMADLNAHDSRDLVKYVLDHPTVPIDEATRSILESKTKVTREYHVIALLPESQYKSLARYARKQRVPVDVLVTSVVRDWLASRSADDV